MPTIPELAHGLHALATTMMAGLVWFVQVVHYPLLGVVPADAFVAYERAHVRRTGLVVAPLMLVEAGSALALLALRRDAPAVVGAALLAGLWISTFAVQVPLHRRLERRFDAIDHRRLVSSNWVRTALWTARSVLAMTLLAGSASA